MQNASALPVISQRSTFLLMAAVLALCAGAAVSAVADTAGLLTHAAQPQPRLIILAAERYAVVPAAAALSDALPIEPASAATPDTGPDLAASAADTPADSASRSGAAPTSGPHAAPPPAPVAAAEPAPAAQESPAETPATEPPPSAALTLEQKAGQLIMTGFGGLDASGPIADLIARRHVGNVVLLGHNVSSPEQVRALTGQIDYAARVANAGIGSLIAVDQEGGRVQRLRPPLFTGMPSARAMAATQSSADVTRWGEVTGSQLRAVGITMNLAPVLDVNDNPANPVIGDRAFSVEPSGVSTYGLAFLSGMHAVGIAGVAKHFPGHGNTATDSHHTLPYIEKSDAALRRTELAPFKNAVAQGVDAIMTAHVVYTAWDQRLPASLSPRIVTGILREELGYQGIVITDDLTMRAISDSYSPGEAAVLAVQAGADLLLTSGSPATIEAMLDALLQAVTTGAISQERLDASVDRILALKRYYGIAP